MMQEDEEDYSLRADGLGWGSKLWARWCSLGDCSAVSR